MIFCAFLACPKHILDDSVLRNGRNKTVFVARCNSFLIILHSIMGVSHWKINTASTLYSFKKKKKKKNVRKKLLYKLSFNL